MLQLPKELPSEIEKVLRLVDFNFDPNERYYPFYFALYSEVNMQGWDTAYKNLKENLTKVLELVKDDHTLENRENKIRILTLNIERLELDLDFYSEEFFWTHKSKYLRTVKSLTRGPRPISYRDFRYSEIRKLRQAGPRRKVGKKANIPEEQTRKMYESYISDFQKDNFNPLLKEYQKLYRKVNPKNLKRYPISEVYEFFNGEMKLIYKNPNIRKNSLERDYSFLRNLCRLKSRALQPKLRFAPFSYIAVPDYIGDGENEIRIFTGSQVAGLAGGGGANYYDLEDGKYVFRGHVNYWRS